METGEPAGEPRLFPGPGHERVEIGELAGEPRLFPVPWGCKECGLSCGFSVFFEKERKTVKR